MECAIFYPPVRNVVNVFVHYRLRGKETILQSAKGNKNVVQSRDGETKGTLK